jgi:NADP-dependent 3-hydroxy acid dehydrogenase YdfG
LVADISSQEGIKDLLDQYKKHEQLVDVIVNNAGVFLKEAKIPSELANKGVASWFPACCEDVGLTSPF